MPQADLFPGDYILTAKLSDMPASENAYLYNLSGDKQAISVSIKSFAGGLSGKLISGDIVSVIAPDYKKQGLTVIPPELTYVEVIGVTASTAMIPIQASRVRMRTKSSFPPPSLCWLRRSRLKFSPSWSGRQAPLFLSCTGVPGRTPQNLSSCRIR
jgi:hypothetical protein